MSDTTYTLEWRGTKKPGLSYADIEAGLAAGDLHSLYKIQVDGKWIVLRDFLEQHRAAEAAAKRSAATAAQQQAAYAPPPQGYYPPQGAPYPYPPQQVPYPPQPHAAPMQHAMPPPPPLQKGRQPVPMPHSPHTKAPASKPAWLWPVIITSVTVCILLVIVAAYVIATKHSGTKLGDNNSNSGSTSSNSPAAKPDGKPVRVKLTPYSITGKEIYPSALVSTATVDWNGDEQTAEDKKTDEDAQIGKHDLPLYGDENSWLGIELEGLKKGAKVSVEITAEGFMKPSREQVTVNTVGEEGRALIMPKIMWDFEALFKVRQQRPINVIFSATVDDAAQPHITETYTLRSINDCPLYLMSKSGKQKTSLSFLVAAYVNENHPQVQDILKEALGCGIVKHFDGYQSKEPKEVVRQVFAVWNALQRRGIKYSDVTATPPGDRVFSQSVRFMHESINSQQANCVDGTVLMASVLEKIGIQSYLVIIPGHCFLAFNLRRNSAALPMGLETTMLGNNEITEVQKLDLLPVQEQNKENDASVKTFLKAVEEGNQTIQSCARELLGQGDARFRLISIDEERGRGIMPIPSTIDK
jgi:hypothetical protein